MSTTMRLGIGAFQRRFLVCNSSKCERAGACWSRQTRYRAHPNYAIAHQWYGLHCALRERFPEAIAEIKRAQELDPLSLIIRHERGWSFCFARQYDEALKQSQKALELDPSFPPAWWMLGQGYPQKGIYDKAIAEFQSGLQLSGGDP